MQRSAVAGVLLGPFAVLLVAVAVIDLRRRIIPHRLVYPALGSYVVAVTGADWSGRA
jgi:Flp pilus assembly protein protease CpaA